MTAPNLIERLPPANILVVDDRQENLVALQGTLSDPSFNVVTVTSGEQALRQLLKDDFAVILMDVRMPTMDGFQTASLIRRREANKHVPIIFLTANDGDIEQVYKGYVAGAVDYLIKPIDPLIVRAKVAVFVDLYRKTELIKVQEARLREIERERSAEALRASDALYKATFDDAAIGIAHTDPTGRWLRVNKQLCAILGYSWERLLSRQLQDVVHPDDYATTVVALDGMLRGEMESYRAETRFVHRAGHAIWVRLTISLHDVPGTGRHFIVVAEDITERIRIEEGQRLVAAASETLLRSLDYKSTLSGVAELMVPWLADGCLFHAVEEEHGGYVELAAAFADPQQQEVAASLRAALCLDPEMGVARAVGTLRSTVLIGTDDPRLVPEEAEAEIVRVAGSLAPLALLTIPLVARGRALGALTLMSGPARGNCTSADVTMAKDIARRAALAIDNARLYQSAQDAIGARDEFISIASHELRTPLTPLQIQLQRLLSDKQREPLEKLTPERVRSILARSERQVQRLTTLIESLLDVSRMSAGRLKLNVEKIDLVELANEVTSRFTEELRRHGIDLSVHAPVSVQGHWDRLRIEQVLTNLISNAIKYGDGKPIDVSIEATGRGARFVIRDAGIGIAVDEQRRIFARFERAAPERTYGGLGLGLYITQQIVDAHGGTVRVESAPGKGSAFTVELPLECPASKEQAASPPRTENHDANRGTVANG